VSLATAFAFSLNGYDRPPAFPKQRMHAAIFFFLGDYLGNLLFSHTTTPVSLVSVSHSLVAQVTTLPKLPIHLVVEPVHEPTEGVAVFENSTFPPSTLHILLKVVPTISTRQHRLKTLQIRLVGILVLLRGFHRVIKRNGMKKVPLSRSPNGGNHTTITLIIFLRKHYKFTLTLNVKKDLISAFNIRCYHRNETNDLLYRL
jgi:hypothetical protein